MLYGDLMGRKSEKDGMYVYSWFTLLHGRNYHNIVKQLYSNKKKFSKPSRLIFPLCKMGIWDVWQLQGIFECSDVTFCLFPLEEKEVHTFLQHSLSAKFYFTPS